MPDSQDGLCSCNSTLLLFESFQEEITTVLIILVVRHMSDNFPRNIISSRGLCNTRLSVFKSISWLAEAYDVDASFDDVYESNDEKT